MPFYQTSMELLAEALDDSGDIILFVGEEPDGRLLIVDCNRSAEQALGRDRRWLAERVALQDLVDDDQMAALAELAKAARARGSHNGDLRLHRYGQSDFWFGYHVMPCASQPGLSMILGRDITTRRAQRLQATAVQGLLAKVFVIVDVGVSIIRPDGRYLMANPFYERMLGQPAGSLVGKAWRETVAADSRELVDAMWRRGDHPSVEIGMLRADGDVVRVRCGACLVDGPDNKKLRIVTLNPHAAPPEAAAVTTQGAGKIRLIPLDFLRRGAGDKWPRMERKMMEAVQAIVTALLGPGETFSRTADDAFMVCLPNSTEAQANAKVEQIAREIRHRLMGEDGRPRFEVSAVAMSGPAGQDMSAVEASLTDIERRAHQAAGDLRAQAAPIKFIANGERMGCYVELASRLPDGGRVSLAPAREDSELTLLRMAANQVVRQADNLPVLFPVDFELLHSASRSEAFLDTCRSLDPRAYRSLVPMLCGLPAGFPAAKLAGVMQRLKPFCARIGFGVDARDEAIPDLGKVPSPILMIDGATWQKLTDVPVRMVCKLVSAVKAQGGAVLVRNVGSAEASGALGALGVELVVE